jgi:hypothetical protein
MSTLPNPPAFPLLCQHGKESYEGLTLRDYFAGQALNGLLSDMETRRSISIKAKVLGISHCDEAAQLCYDYADAMLKARLQGEEKNT